MLLFLLQLFLISFTSYHITFLLNITFISYTACHSRRSLASSSIATYFIYFLILRLFRFICYLTISSLTHWRSFFYNLRSPRYRCLIVTSISIIMIIEGMRRIFVISSLTDLIVASIGIWSIGSMRLTTWMGYRH